MTTEDLPTPCLVLDLDRFESSLKKMAAHARAHSISLRPHAKTHKSAEIARHQVEAGALGVCVATMAEAEVMAAKGIRGLLITAEQVGRPKVSRLIRLLRQAADTMVVVDDPLNVQELQEAAQAAKLRVPVMIDVDVGTRRTGAEPGRPSLSVAEAIGKSKNLDFKGLCAYAGHCAHVVGFDRRRAQSHGAMAGALETRELLKKNGFEVQILSGGSTGTYNIDIEVDGMSELQVGSYLFMDVDYRNIGGRSGAVYEDFEPALTVLTTVIHRSGDKAVLDAGFKAFATDRPFGPQPLDVAGIAYSFAGDEHGRVTVANPSRDIRLGDRLRWIVPHCDPNVNLYDRYYCVRGAQVEAVWPVMDRASEIGTF